MGNLNISSSFSSYGKPQTGFWNDEQIQGHFVDEEFLNDYTILD